MGVKHGRDYELILQELTNAMAAVEDSYLFFEMEPQEWDRLSAEEKHEVLEALAEDLFYGLGTESVIPVGSSVVIYAPEEHRIHVLVGEQELTFVSLV